MCVEDNSKVLDKLPICVVCGKQATLETVSLFIVRNNGIYCLSCLEKKEMEIRQQFITKSTEPEFSEVPEHPFEAPSREEHYWYPAFKLRENPFKFLEAALEADAELPFIDTPMHKQIKALISGEISAIVVGPRGCGKSRLIQEITFENRGLITIVSPKTVLEIHDVIYNAMDNIDEAGILDTIITICGKYPTKCAHIAETSYCKICPHHCRVPFVRGEKNFEAMLHPLMRAPTPCKLKRKIADKMLLNHQIMEKVLLIDVPDNLNKQNLKGMVRLCESLLDCINTVIVFATQSQAELLASTDTFSRLPKVSWTLPNQNFFQKFLKDRVDAFRSGDAPYPFKEEVVDRIIQHSNHIIRDFIQICNRVLVEMWIKGLTEPCDLRFVESLNIKRVSLSEQDVIFRVLDRYKGDWVGISQLASDFEERFGTHFTPRKTGALLKKLGFTMRRYDNSGKAEALITPSLLDAIKNQSSESSGSPETLESQLK